MQKVLLEQMLANKTVETKKQVSSAFANISCNFEFAVSVTMSQMQRHMDDANEKGFVVWCNQDSKSAVIYGAGSIYDVADCLSWLYVIRVKNEPAVAHYAAADGEKVVEIT